MKTVISLGIHTTGGRWCMPRNHPDGREMPDPSSGSPTTGLGCRKVPTCNKRGYHLKGTRTLLKETRIPSIISKVTFLRERSWHSVGVLRLFTQCGLHTAAVATSAFVCGSVHTSPRRLPKRSNCKILLITAATERASRYIEMNVSAHRQRCTAAF